MPRRNHRRKKYRVEYTNGHEGKKLAFETMASSPKNAIKHLKAKAKVTGCRKHGNEPLRFGSPGPYQAKEADGQIYKGG